MGWALDTQQILSQQIKNGLPISISLQNAAAIVNALAAPVFGGLDDRKMLVRIYYMPGALLYLSSFANSDSSSSARIRSHILVTYPVQIDTGQGPPRQGHLIALQRSGSPSFDDVGENPSLPVR